MEWKSPFIIYRLNVESKLDEVYHTADMKKAKYWLSYIAQPGDVLCRTPAHPKHSRKSAQPEYWQHKEMSGKTSAEGDKWTEYARGKGFTLKYPEEQQREPE